MDLYVYFWGFSKDPATGEERPLACPCQSWSFSAGSGMYGRSPYYTTGGAGDEEEMWSAVEWSVERVGAWLKRGGASDALVNKFAQEDMDGRALVELQLDEMTRLCKATQETSGTRLKLEARLMRLLQVWNRRDGEEQAKESPTMDINLSILVNASSTLLLRHLHGKEDVPRVLVVGYKNTNNNNNGWGGGREDRSDGEEGEEGEEGQLGEEEDEDQEGEEGEEKKKKTKKAGGPLPQGTPVLFVDMRGAHVSNASISSNGEQGVQFSSPMNISFQPQRLLLANRGRAGDTASLGGHWPARLLGLDPRDLPSGDLPKHFLTSQGAGVCAGFLSGARSGSFEEWGTHARWSRATHLIYPPTFRQAVFTLLLAHARKGQTLFALLPRDVLMLVIGKLAVHYNADPFDLVPPHPNPRPPAQENENNDQGGAALAW